MEIYEKFDGDEQLIWDMSSLSLLMACPYKYYLSRIYGWRLPSKYGSHKANWGKAYHACLETYHEALFEGCETKEALHRATKAAYEWRDELAHDDTTGQKPDNARTMGTLIRSIIWYSEQYPDDTLKTVATPDGDPTLEIRFEVPLIGTKYRLSGRIDRLAELEGVQYLVDNKTTGLALDKRYFDNFAVDNQILAYNWAVREQLKMPIGGFIVDAAQTLVGGTRFKREIFSVTPEQTEEWHAMAIYYVNEVEKYIEEGAWPQNLSSCGLYGGCQFRRLCARPASMRSAFLASEYITEPRPDQDHTTAKGFKI